MHTMADPLERASSVAPDSVAVVCGDERVKYAEMWHRCRRLAGHLTRLGLKRGDRVVVVGANCHRYVEAHQAIPGMGLVIVPLNTRSSEAELAFASEDSGARALLTDMPPRPFEKHFEHVIRMPDDYEEALATAPDGELGLGAGITENDLAGIFYTSGTTGKAKGVMLTHRNLVANAWTALVWAKLGEDDRWLLMAPMFHAAGTCAVLASTWVAAAQVVLPTFDPDRARADRVGAGDSHARRANDAHRDDRSSAPPAEASVVAPAAQPRSSPHRHRGASSGSQGVP